MGSPRFGGTYPPLLEALIDSVKLRLELSGVDSELAELVALEAAETIRTQWGGSEPYVAKGRRYDLWRRNQEIFRRFDGRNIDELCRAYGLTRMRLYQVLSSVRAELRAKQQPSPARTKVKPSP